MISKPIELLQGEKGRIMKPMDLSELIKGLMVIIGIALAAGKLPELKQWAIKRAFAPQGAYSQKFVPQVTNPSPALD